LRASVISRHIFDRQENGLRVDALAMNAQSINRHLFPPDPREIMLHDKIIDLAVLRQDLFQQLAQSGDVPLAVSEIVKVLATGRVRIRLEEPVKGRVGGDNSQTSVKRDQRIADCLDNTFCEISRLGPTRRSLLADIREGNDDAVNEVIESAIGMTG
jgi:hypothetical protein